MIRFYTNDQIILDHVPTNLFVDNLSDNTRLYNLEGKEFPLKKKKYTLASYDAKPRSDKTGTLAEFEEEVRHLMQGH